MPYVVLKKKKLMQGQDDAIVVPDVWVSETVEGEEAFVFLPVADCDTIKTYLKEQTAPLEGWEKHECDILCRNIPNLIQAYKTIDKLQNETSADDFTELFYEVPPKRPKRDEPRNKSAPNVVEEDEQKIFPLFKTGQESEDPFGDIIPPLELPLLADEDDQPFEENETAEGERENMDKQTRDTYFRSEQKNDSFGASLSVTSESSLAATETNSNRSRSAKKRAYTVEQKQQSDEEASSEHNATSEVEAPNNDDAPSWYSYAKVRSKNDRQMRAERAERADAEQIAQLFDLIYELKSMMISNQGEIKKYIHESFAQMQKNVSILISNKMEVLKQNMQHYMSKESNNNQQVVSTAGINIVTFKKLMVIEDVERFDSQLIDPEFRKQFHHLIDDAVKNESNPTTRMRIVLYLMFDRKLFNQFNWGGGIGKEALKKYKNITDVLEYGGTTPTRRMTPVKVVQFIQSEAAYVQWWKVDATASKTTEQVIPTPDSGAVNTVENLYKTIPSLRVESKTLEQVNPIPDSEVVNTLENLCKTIPNLHVEVRPNVGKTPNLTTVPVAVPEVQSNTENAPSSSREGDRLRKAPTNPTNNLAKCITCVKVLGSFENRLNDTKMQQQVHKWIDKVVGHEQNVEKRLLKLFNRLIDIKVLENFHWLKCKGDYRPLSEYTNFIQLFVYASNAKKESEPTPLMRENVNKFFTKQLRYADWRKKEMNLPASSSSVRKN